MLAIANGPQSPKKLAQALALSAPNLTMLLDRLQQRGLLRRERSQVDRRSQNVVLTAEGQRIAVASAAAAAPMEHTLFERLSRAEHAMLIELLRQVAGRSRRGGKPGLSGQQVELRLGPALPALRLGQHPPSMRWALGAACRSRSLSDLGIVGCNLAAAVHFSPAFCPIATAMGLQTRSARWRCPSPRPSCCRF